MELIEQEAGLAMPIRPVGEYLRRWSLAPQKPMRRACEQNPRAVQRWLDEEYSQTKARARVEAAEIYWGDETGLRSDSQHERGYAPKGKAPVVRLNANRASANMISAVTNQGKVRFRVFDGRMSADILIDSCKRLIKSAGRKVFLALDKLRVHHAKVFKAWLAKHEDGIEMFSLPSCSPELNPDQYLKCDLKAGVHSARAGEEQSAAQEEGYFTYAYAAEKAAARREIFRA
jgi:hypothetical protein